MQQTRESEVPVSGATETPLTSAAQLTPGVYLTGPSWQHLWMVDALVMQGDEPAQVRMHVVRAVGTPTAQRERTVPITSIIPAAPDVFRTFVISPVLPPVDVSAQTIYLVGARAASVIHEWHAQELSPTHQYPLFTVMHPLWTLPAAVRALLTGGR